MNKQRGNTKIIIPLVAVFLLAALYFFSMKGDSKDKMADQMEAPEKVTTTTDEVMLKEDEVVMEEDSIEPSEDGQAVVVFTPSGLFSESERAELGEKMIAPFLEFNEEYGTSYLTVDITKYEPIPEHGYKYEVDAIGEGGIHTAFLYGSSDPLEWWIPDCLDGCTFSDYFSEKYPEIVELSN